VNKRTESLLKGLVYYIMVVLVLQVGKAILSKSSVPYSYFIGTILLAVQILVTLGFLLIPFFVFVVKKRAPGKKAMLFSCLLFALLMAMLEILFTYWLYHPVEIPRFLRASYVYYYKERAMHIIQFDADACTYSPKLFYTLKPNVSYTFSNPEFSTHVVANKLGFRGSDQSLDKPNVICIGDSFTFGWGVEQQETFASQLQASNRYKVVNAGIPSYGTAREITSLFCFDCSHVSCIPIQFCSNDLEENNAFIKNHDTLRISSQKEFEETARSHKINQRYFPGKNFLLISQTWLKMLVNKIHPVFSFTNDSPIVDAKAVKGFLDIVATAPVDFSKVKFLIFQLDSPAESSGFAHLTDSLIHTPHYQAIFKNNIKAIDFGKVLTKKDYFSLDQHINASGHQKVATVLEKELRNF